MSLAHHFLRTSVQVPAPAVSVSHIVFQQPGETFLALQVSEGRFPVSKVRFVEGVLTWERADGASEFMDTASCESLSSLMEAFEGEDGLMILSYPELSDLSHADAPPIDVVFISTRDAQPSRLEVDRA